MAKVPIRRPKHCQHRIAVVVVIVIIVVLIGIIRRISPSMMSIMIR